MKQALAWSTSLLLMVCAATAVAEGNSTLYGNYGFTGSGICNLAGGFVGTSTSTGTVTFNGDGTGAASFLSHGSEAGAIGSAGANETSFTFTYSVNGDGSWTRSVDPGSIKGTQLSGPNAGLTFSTDQFSRNRGFIGIFAQTLTTVTDEAVVETTTWSNGTVGQRICQRSGVLIKRRD